MGKLRTRLLAIGGLVLGIVTLRSLRKRRAQQAEPDAVEAVHDELDSASDHAAAAVEHARLATTKAVEEARK